MSRSSPRRWLWALAPVLTLALALAACTCGRRGPPPDPCRVNGQNPCDEPNRTVCVIEGGAARCLCDEGYLARPNGACEPIGPTNCPEHGGDSAEPDDCLAHARVFSPSSPPRTQLIDPVGDYDFFRFDAIARHVYILTAKPSGTLLPRIDVFDQGGIWLAADEAILQAQLGFKAHSTAPYFARVSQSPLDPSVSTGAYTFTLETIGQEDHEETPAEATYLIAQPASSSQTTFGRFEYAGDQDWFRFDGSIDYQYRVEFDPTRGPIPLFSLFINDTFTLPAWTAQQSIVDFVLTRSETVYLVLYAPPELGSYSFELTRSPR